MKNSLIDSLMSLGDHLEELRVRLILALAGLAVALIVCLALGKYIILFIEQPYLKVVHSEVNHIINPAVASNTPVIANTDNYRRLQSLAPAEGFTAYIKICTISAVVIASPWIFYHLWMFIAAGLYPHERKYVNLAAPFSALLFIIGALFFLFIIAPLTLGYLIKFNTKFLGIESNFTFSYYITFVTNLMLVFGLAFQTPTAIFFLNRTGLVSLDTLRKSRKYVILAIFIIAAILTPPDVLSQITLSIPIYFLFELAIILCIIAEKRAQKKM